MKLRKAVFRLSAPILKWWAKRYFSKTRKYSHLGIKGVILPGVFFPHFTWSTSILMDFLAKEDLKNKRFLELGCGSGLISALAAKKGAKVTASDINHKAIENAKLNAENNSVEVRTLLSDLFDEIPLQQFDYVVINPPYYPKNAESDAEKAWFCGEEFQYFKKLFSTIRPYFGENSKVTIILSEDCEIEDINTLAKDNQLLLKPLKEVENWAEKNFIFQLESIF